MRIQNFLLTLGIALGILFFLLFVIAFIFSCSSNPDSFELGGTDTAEDLPSELGGTDTAEDLPSELGDTDTAEDLPSELGGTDTPTKASTDLEDAGCPDLCPPMVITTPDYGRAWIDCFDCSTCQTGDCRGWVITTCVRAWQPAQLTPEMEREDCEYVRCCGD